MIICVSSMKKSRTNIIERFSKNLAQIRKEKEYSQRQLSQLCRIDNADISRMENGDINVTLNTVEQLAEALEVDPTELIKK